MSGKITYSTGTTSEQTCSQIPQQPQFLEESQTVHQDLEMWMIGLMAELALLVEFLTCKKPTKYPTTASSYKPS